MTTIICGIDEVGYGSKLGPLVVTLTAIETKDPNLNLWEALSGVVKKVKGNGLRVWDSKKVYNGRIASLEPTALAFLRLVKKVKSLDDIHDLQWNKQSLSLPCEKAPEAHDVGRLRDRLVEIETKFVEFGIKVVDAKNFNEGVRHAGNKHLLLFNVITDLVNSVIRTQECGSYHFRIGRLGGRKFYLPLIVKGIEGGVMIQQETSEASVYTIRRQKRVIKLSFITDGDSTDFLMGLSSIIGKYTRECYMRLFNGYWIEKAGLSRPCAGYGKDVHRFMKEIKPFISKLSLEEDAILRIK